MNLDHMEDHPGKTMSVDDRTKEFITGDITRDAYLGYLDEQRQQIVDLLDQSNPEEFDEELRLMTQDYLPDMRTGLQMHLEGFDALEDWVHSSDANCKKQGFALLESGDVFLRRALRGSLELSVHLNDQAGELLKALGHEV